MEERTLDELAGKRSVRNARLSFWFMLFSIACITIVILGFIANAEGDFAKVFFPGVFILFLLSSILGIGFSIVSLVKKEPFSVLKILALIGNSLILFVVFGLIGFLIMDIMTAGYIQ